MRGWLLNGVRQEWRWFRSLALPVLVGSAAEACVTRDDVVLQQGGSGGQAAGGSSGSAGGGSGGEAMAAGAGGGGQDETGGSSGAGPGPEPAGRCESFDEAACVSECLRTEISYGRDGGTVDLAAECMRAYTDVLTCHIAVNDWKCDSIPDGLKCRLAGYYNGCGLVDAGSIPTHPVVRSYQCPDQVNYLEGCLQGWYHTNDPLDAGADVDVPDAPPIPALEPLCAEICRLQNAYQIRDSGTPP